LEASSQAAKSKDKVWRIDRIIGRTMPDKEIYSASIKAFAANPTQTNFLVIEDLGLGWMECLTKINPSDKENAGKMIPALMEELINNTNPEQIILKLSYLSAGLPFAQYIDYLNKTTVIISAHTLRERGAAISEGLSWDRTIEDTVREFSSGLSSLDLALCRRVVVFFSAEGAAVFKRENKSSEFRLEKFLYHPSQYEGSFKAGHPGKMSGHLSLATAAVIRHLVLGNQYPLFVALSLALIAIRKQQEDGLQENKKAKHKEEQFNFEKHTKNLSDILSLTDCLTAKADSSDGKENQDMKEAIEKQKEKLKEYLKTFSCSFRHDLLEYPPWTYDPPAADQGQKLSWKSDLLRDVTGYTTEYVAAKAFQIVMQGTKDAMPHMPVAKYKNFLTADREEIERINAIRKLIMTYRDNPQDKKPLSLAVFGPPGSGKSFSIKQLAAELGFTEKSIRTFNLSEFKAAEELHVAFHIVRDATIQGEIPLIFWDEFDSDGLKWLKEFLAPMQDAEFRAGSVVHPLGKAVFIFAGGVFSTFEEFEEKTKDERNNDQVKWKDDKDNNEKKVVTDDSYKGKKAPDFISRLRGYVNVKGPNPQQVGDNHGEYLIRRALLLRSVLERTHNQLLDENLKMSINAPLVQAFLRVSKYKHGARSLESIITMSNLVNASFFGEAALPPDHLLNLHVDTKEFKSIISCATLDVPMIEIIAEACHDGWKKQKTDDGYSYGEKRSDIPPKTHELLVDYRTLTEKSKESNRLTARVTQAKLDEADLEIINPVHAKTSVGIDPLTNEKIHLIKIEHDIWMRDHLLQGYEYANNTEDDLKLHQCICRFADLTEKDQKLDKAIVDSIENALKEHSYGVVKMIPKQVKNNKKKKVS